MRVPLIATKDMTYATRRLKVDEPFEATRQDARLLVGLKRAKLVETPPEDERPALRAQYHEKVGKQPFNGWDAATLREKIAAADD